MGEYTEAAAQKAALIVHNEAALRPMPDADLPRYTDETTRQMALTAAEQINIARAATDANVPVEVWLAKKEELGRSPRRGDFAESAS